jgi:hypothetical protein
MRSATYLADKTLPLDEEGCIKTTLSLATPDFTVVALKFIEKRG